MVCEASGLGPMFRPMIHFRADGARRALKVQRVMVTVHAIKQIYRHAKKTRRFPFVDACLHKPCGSGVSQSVRRDLAIWESEGHSAFESRLDRFGRLTIPLNNVISNDPFGLPAAQVGQQTGGIGAGGWRLLLCRPREELHQRLAVLVRADELLRHFGAGRVGRRSDLEKPRHGFRRPDDVEFLQRF